MKDHVIAPEPGAGLTSLYKAPLRSKLLYRKSGGFENICNAYYAFHIWVGRANGKRNATRNEIGNAKLNFYCQPQLLRLSVANNYTIAVNLRGEEAEIISVKWSWRKNWKESARDSLEEVGKVKEKFIFKNRFSTLSTGREILLGEIQFAGQDLL